MSTRVTSLIIAFVCLSSAIVLADPGKDAIERLFKNEIPAEIQTALDQSQDVRLLSINPSGFGAFDGETFSAKVFGETKLEKDDRQRVVEAFRKGVADQAAENKRKGGIGGAGCFIPRHNIRVVHAGIRYDLLICFQCSGVQIYKDGKLVDGLGIRSGNDKEYPKVMNDVLTAAKIPLPPQK